MPYTLTEIWGLPSSGKTHTAIEGWPNPLLVDTAYTSLGFREIGIERATDERGESWPVLLKLHDYDEDAAEQHYHYMAEWPDDLMVMEGYDTIILDNAADLRVIAANAWCEETGNDWPQQAQWGKINDMLDSLFRQLGDDHHVVVISQMKDEYVNDAKTGDKTRDGPKRMDYKADFRLKLEADSDGRSAIVKKNRYMDPTSDEVGAEGTDLGESPSFQELMLYSGIPQERWNTDE